MELNGQIISGEMDSGNNEFQLTSVKHLTTESTLTKQELEVLHDYLLAHIDEVDGQILTLNDQLLVRLTKEEINQLLQDLDDIKRLL